MTTALCVDRYGNNINVRGCELAGPLSESFLSQFGDLEVNNSLEEDTINIRFLGEKRRAAITAEQAFPDLVRYLEEIGYVVNPKFEDMIKYLELLGHEINPRANTDLLHDSPYTILVH